MRRTPVELLQNLVTAMRNAERDEYFQLNRSIHDTNIEKALKAAEKELENEPSESNAL